MNLGLGHPERQRQQQRPPTLERGGLGTRLRTRTHAGWCVRPGPGPR
ncbi:hypothetical protein CZ771_07925 [Actinomycetales bacterium JB111]|nr:hypothetical protein CZ771_07925 [Actinomycetales bacterium JB111]